MRVNMMTSDPTDMTHSRVPVLLARAVGVLVGVTAGLFLLALLTAGKANADQQAGTHSDESAKHTGLLGAVTGTVGNVVDDVVEAPLVQAVTEVAEPVARPVAQITAPVLEPVVRIAAPVLEPVTRELAPALSPVTDLVEPITGPITEHITGPITGPVTGPVVRALDPVARPVDVATGVEPAAAAEAQATPASTEPAPPVVLSGDAVTTKVWHAAGHVVPAHPVEAAKAVAESGAWSGKSMPRAPWSPPSGPAVTGTSSGTAGSSPGGGVDSPVLTGARVVPRPTGSWDAPAGTSVGPAWWSSYGRHHPS